MTPEILRAVEKLIGRKLGEFEVAHLLRRLPPDYRVVDVLNLLSSFVPGAMEFRAGPYAHSNSMRAIGEHKDLLEQHIKERDSKKEDKDDRDD